jgi:hypothetical protein
MAGLPPPPSNDPPGSFAWVEWYRLLRNYISSASSIPWSTIQFAGSDIGDIATKRHNDLESFQGGQSGEYYHLKSADYTDLTDAGDSALHYHATDRARANHTGTQAMSTISDLPTLASGTYTPTPTNATNISASTAHSAQYLRVGSVVTVSGKVDIDATAAGSAVLRLSLPIASNFANTNECAGTASANGVAGQCAGIIANPTTDEAQLQFIAVDLASNSMYYTYTYRII